MKRGKLSLKDSIKVGVISGVMFSTIVALYDYFTGHEFSIINFIVYIIVFGLVMSIFFKYKHTLE